MWKVLLSEGESPGARGPELYEPLRTGTCVLAQVLVGRGALACLPAIREGPQETALDGVAVRRATASSSATELVPWYYRWGHRSQEQKGGILGLPARRPGFGEGASW